MKSIIKTSNNVTTSYNVLGAASICHVLNDMMQSNIRSGISNL